MSNWIGGEHQRLIVTAANRIKYRQWGIDRTLIVIGVRHCDGLMNMQMKAAGISHKDRIEVEQGFIDNSGKFLDRKEALAVAIAANQINVRREKTSPEDELFSEDLH